MDVQELTKPAERESGGRRGWVVAALAFGAVIFAVGLSVILAQRQTDDVPPATTPPTTEAVASTTEAAPTTTVASEEPAPTTTAAPTVDVEALAFVEGLLNELTAGDIEAAVARFPEAMTFQSRLFGIDVVRPWVTYMVAMDSAFELEDCRPVLGGTTRCIWQRTGVDEPYHPLRERMSYQVRLEDGVAVYAQVNHEKDAWWDTEVAFAEWLLETDPEAANAIYSIQTADDLVVVTAPLFSDGTREAEIKKQYVQAWRDNGGGGP